MRADRSSRTSKTTARPECSNSRSSAAARFKIDPLGAMFPNSASNPPVAWNGWSIDLMTSRSTKSGG